MTEMKIVKMYDGLVTDSMNYDEVTVNMSLTHRLNIIESMS